MVRLLLRLFFFLLILCTCPLSLRSTGRSPRCRWWYVAGCCRCHGCSGRGRGGGGCWRYGCQTGCVEKLRWIYLSTVIIFILLCKYDAFTFLCCCNWRSLVNFSDFLIAWSFWMGMGISDGACAFLLRFYVCIALDFERNYFLCA